VYSLLLVAYLRS